MIRLPSSGTVGLCAGRVPQAMSTCRRGPASSLRSRRSRACADRGIGRCRDSVATRLRLSWARTTSISRPRTFWTRKARSGHRDVLGDRVVAAVERALAEPGEVQDRLAQRLRRNRAGVEAHAADHLLAVDDGDLLAELRRGDRALLAGRAGADDDEVVRRGVHRPSASHGRPEVLMGRRRRRRARRFPPRR